MSTSELDVWNNITTPELDVKYITLTPNLGVGCAKLRRATGVSSGQFVSAAYVWLSNYDAHDFYVYGQICRTMFKNP